MNFDNIELRTEGETLIITLNRPKAMNALNLSVLANLSLVLDELETDDQWKGAILTGSGEKAFAAGADIAELAQLDVAGAEKVGRNGQALFRRIEGFSKPIIGAVNGFALGGGCELCMACHLRVASENARFGQPEVNLGVIAGYGGTQRLVQLIGRGKATELLITADMIKAPEALTLGLVNHVVPQEELIGKCQEILGKVYTKSPLAIALTLNAIQTGLYDRQAGYEAEVKNFGKAIASEDGKEGTAAFLEKRKPNFTGK